DEGHVLQRRDHLRAADFIDGEPYEWHAPPELGRSALQRELAGTGPRQDQVKVYGARPDPLPQRHQSTHELSVWLGIAGGPEVRPVQRSHRAFDEEREVSGRPERLEGFHHTVDGTLV